jgi:hypothetical protein
MRPRGFHPLIASEIDVRTPFSDTSPRQNINHADESVFVRQRNLHGDRGHMETLRYLTNDTLIAGTFAIQLVHERQHRDPMPVRLTPYGLRLGLYAANAAENGYRAIQNPENPFNLRREIHMAGRIDHVDPYITPLANH